MIAFFQRFNASFNLREEDLPLELVVACFNPLVIAQFWSAYSDSAFGASFLVSFVLLDKLLKDRVSKVATALAYTLTVMLAVFTFGVLPVVAAPRIAVTRESAPLFAVLAAYMHIFMVFHASIFNLRFFIPVFPLMALVIVSALRSVKRKRLVAACVATYALM